MRYSTPLLLGIAVLVGTAGCSKTLVKQQKVESRKALAAGLKKLEIRNRNGKIDLIGEAAVEPAITVTATKWAKASSADKAKAALKKIKVRIYRRGDLATLIIKQPESTRTEKYGVELHVAVPYNVAVDADTRSGTIRSLGLSGALALRTASGNIEARNARAAVTAETQRGNIIVSGKIPAFTVHTKKGNATVHVRNLTELTEASMIRADRGSVQLSLNREFNARLSVEASGRIVVPWSGLRSKGKSRSGTIGAGGRLITIQAPGGGVKLMKRIYIQAKQHRMRIPGKKYPQPRHRPDPPRIPMGHGHGHGH